VCIQDTTAADERAAHETRPNRALDRAAEVVAVTNDADPAPGEAAGSLAHSRTASKVGIAHGAAARRARLANAATDHPRVIICNRLLARVGSLRARRGMQARRVRRISMSTRSRLGLPTRGRPLSLDARVIMLLPRVLAVGIDRGDTGKAGEGDQRESRICPTIQTRHIVTPGAAGQSGAALEGCSE